MEVKISGLICVLCIFLMFAVPLYIYFGIQLPADIQYNNLFGDHIQMAYDQSDFGKMLEQVIYIDNETHVLFAGKDWSHTYNTWWAGDQTYSNSLDASDNYYKGLEKTLQGYITEEAKYSNPNYTSLTPYTQWKMTAIANTRIEMKYNGGLGWVIDGAWYLTFNPIAYWAFWYEVLAIVVFFIIAIISGIVALA